MQGGAAAPPCFLRKCPNHSNVIKLSKDCHSEERSDVGIRPKNGLPRQFENWLAMTETLTK